MAVDRPARQDGSFDVDQIPVVAFQRQAEYILQNAKLNDMFIVDGRIQVRTEDLASGVRNWVTEVVVDYVKKLSDINFRKFFTNSIKY